MPLGAFGTVRKSGFLGERSFFLVSVTWEPFHVSAPKWRGASLEIIAMRDWEREVIVRIVMSIGPPWRDDCYASQLQNIILQTDVEVKSKRIPIPSAPGSMRLRSKKPSRVYS